MSVSPLIASLTYSFVTHSPVMPLPSGTLTLVELGFLVCWSSWGLNVHTFFCALFLIISLSLVALSTLSSPIACRGWDERNYFLINRNYAISFFVLTLHCLYMLHWVVYSAPSGKPFDIAVVPDFLSCLDHQQLSERMASVQPPLNFWAELVVCLVELMALFF